MRTVVAVMVAVTVVGCGPQSQEAAWDDAITPLMTRWAELLGIFGETIEGDVVAWDKARPACDAMVKVLNEEMAELPPAPSSDLGRISTELFTAMRQTAESCLAQDSVQLRIQVELGVDLTREYRAECVVLDEVC